MKETKPAWYAVGMFGTSLPINLFRTFGMYFYVSVLGLEMTRWALILLIFAFIDFIDSPIYGYFSDRTRTRWGRRRPWIIPGSILSALFLIAFFNPAGWAMTATMLMPYAMVTFILAETFDSFTGTSYGALFPDLFRSAKSRAMTNMYRQIFQFIAMAIGIAVTPVIVDAIGSYGTTAIVYGVIGAAVIITSNLNCHERIEEIKTLEKPKFLPAVLAVAKNFKFWIAGLTGAFYTTGVALLMASMMFFANYTLGLTATETMIVFATVLVVAMCTVPLWTYFIRKYGVVPVWKMALIGVGTAYVPLMFVNNMLAAIFACVYFGFVYSGVICTFDLVGAKIIDEDRVRSGGIRREAIFSALSSFVGRLHRLLVALGVFLASAIYGYISGDEPGERPADAARFMTAFFPFFMMIISVALSRFLHLPDNQEDK
jgi:GPH family glycoside/pentoside/hexuronide:cation symporter